MHFAEMGQGELRVHLVSVSCHSNNNVAMSMNERNEMDERNAVKVARDTRQDLQ